MLNPIELIIDPVTWAFLALYGAVLGWEALFPARVLPSISGWGMRCAATFALFFYLSSWLPLLWDPLIAPYQLVDLTGLGTVPGAAVGILLYEAGTYFWHRLMHSNRFLWLGLHQMHHSAERLDAAGAFYFSPLDMVGWTALSSLCLTLLIGISPGAITVFILTTSFFSMFQHANVKTPRWIGYLVQRPESHSIHHARNEHRKNYSDLPVYDLLFGTFENPRHHAPETGFYEGASGRVVDMLSFRDVSEPAIPANARSAA